MKKGNSFMNPSEYFQDPANSPAILQVTLFVLVLLFLIQIIEIMKKNSVI